MDIMGQMQKYSFLILLGFLSFSTFVTGVSEKLNKITSSEEENNGTRKRFLYCPEVKKDVIALLDISGANENVFLRQKHLLLDIIEVTGVLDGKNRFGLITFSESVDLRLSLSFSNSNESEILSAVQNLGIVEGASSTAEAFQLALMEWKHHGNENASTVFILLQDGLSKDRWPITIKTSELLRENGITVLAVSLNSNFYPSELVQYAGSPEKVFTGRRFNGFIPFLRAIIKGNCNRRLETYNYDEMLGSGSNTETTIGERNDTMESDPCKETDRATEVIILLDISGMDENHLETQKNTINSLFTSLASAPSTRIALIPYGGSTVPSPLFGLENSLNVTEMVALVDELEPDFNNGTSSSTSKAVFEAMNEFNRNGLLGSEILLLLFVGHSDDLHTETFAAVDALRAKDAQVYCMLCSFDVSAQEIMEYVDQKDERLFEESQGKQFINSVESALNRKRCPQQKLTEGKPSVLFQKDPCTVEQTDLIILVDTSVSLQSEFKKHVTLVERIVRSISEAIKEGTNVGIVTFNDTVEVITSLSEHSNVDRLLDAVSKLKFSQGNTRSVWGIRIALKELRVNGRPNAMPVIVHLSDGKSQDSWEDVRRAGKKLREYGIRLLAATYSWEPDLGELGEYTGHENSRLYLSKDTDRLINDLHDVTMKTNCTKQLSVELPLDVETIQRISQDPNSQEEEVLDAPPCSPRKTDILLLVDTSAKTETIFRNGVTEIIKLVEYLGDKTGNMDLIRLGVVDFFEYAEFIGESINTADLVRTMKQLKYEKYGNANVVSAISIGLDQFIQYSRVDAQKIILIFSDGNSRNRWEDIQAAGEQLRQVALVYAVTYDSAVNMEALTAFTSSETQIYMPERRQELFSEIRHLLESANCQPLEQNNHPIEGNSIAENEDSANKVVEDSFSLETLTEESLVTMSTQIVPELTVTAARNGEIDINETATLSTTAKITSFKQSKLQKSHIIFSNPTRKHCDEAVAVDLILAIDISSSESITFRRKQLADIIVSWLLLISAPSSMKNRIALIEFNQDSRLLLNLDAEDGLRQILPMIEKMQHAGGFTGSANAIKLVAQQIATRGRNSALPLVVLLSDGDSKEPWPTLIISSDELRRTGAEVFAITVSEDAYLPELVLYSGSPHRVYTDAKINQLLRDLDNLIFVEYCYRLKGYLPGQKVSEVDLSKIELDEDFGPPGFAPPVEHETTSAPEISSTDMPSICPMPEIDLLLIIDTSGSSQHVFLQQQELATQIVQSLPRDFQFSRVALAIVRFSGDAVLEVPFSSYQSRAALIHRLGNLEFTGGSTALAQAILLATKELERGQRSHAKPVVILMTDGKSEDPWEITKQRSAELHRTGALVYVVSFSKSLSFTDLESYAGSPDRVFLEEMAPEIVKELHTLLNPSPENCGSPLPVSPAWSLVTQPIRNLAQLKLSTNAPVVKLNCQPARTDIIFILDTTSNYQEFIAYRSLLLNTITELLSYDIDGSRFAVSIIRVADSIIVEVPLSQSETEELMSLKIHSIPHSNGATPNADGIQVALTSFEQFGRPGARPLLVVFSSSKSVVSASFATENRGIETFVVSLTDQTFATIPSRMRIYNRETVDLFTVDIRLITNIVPCLYYLNSERGLTSAPVTLSPLQDLESTMSTSEVTPAGGVYYHHFTTTSSVLPSSSTGVWTTEVTELFPDDSSNELETVPRATENLVEKYPNVLANKPDKNIVPNEPILNNDNTLVSELDSNGNVIFNQPFSSKGVVAKPYDQFQSETDCTRAPVDIVLLFDISDGVKLREFLKQKSLGRNLLEHLYALVDGLSVSLISFNSYVKQVLQLSPVRKAAKVYEALDSIEYSGGQTATSDAVHLAVDELKKAARPEATQIVVLFNSGNSMDIWHKAMTVSAELQSTGSQVFAVTFSRDVYIRELKLYAGSLHRVYLGKRIAQLIPDVTESIMVSCGLVDGPARLITRPPFLAVRRRVTQIVKRSTSTICQPENVDLVIVFDKSTSVEKVFEHQIELTLSLVDKLPISTDGRIAVSLVSYSDFPELVLPLIPGRSKFEVRTAVEKLVHTGGSTATASAIQLAISDYNEGRRPDAIPIFVLLNDGNSQDPWKLVLQTSDLIDSLGLSRFAAALSDNVYIPELMHYVGLEKIYRLSHSRQFIEDIERTARTLGFNCDKFGTTPRTTVTTTIKRTTKGRRTTPRVASTTAQATTTTSLCRPNFVDIMILLDRAPADSEIFETQKSVILDLLGTLPLPPRSNVARVSVIAYSTNTKFIVGFSPLQRRDKILRKVSNVKYSTGASKTANAMKEAQREFIQKGRTNARRILISFTDGNSGDSWATASQRALELESNQIQVHCVALGENNFEGELLLYSRADERIYNANSIGTLSSEIEALTEEVVCNGEIFAHKISDNELTNEFIEDDFEFAEGQFRNCSLDMVLVMDASGSIEDTFTELKKLAAQIASKFYYPSEGGARIAVIKYAGPGKSRVFIGLDQSMTKTELVATIESMTHTSGITETSEALNLAYSEFQRGVESSKRTNQSVRRICLIFTDGFATTDPLEAAERLRHEGVEIFAASSSTDDAIGLKELKLLAGDESRIFTDQSRANFFDSIERQCLV